MTQITSIKLGLIAICIATVSLSLAQTPRTGTSGSNKTAATIGTAAGHSGLSGNFPSAVQTGTNFRGSTGTRADRECRSTHRDKRGSADRDRIKPVGINGGVGGLGGSSGNSTGTTQIGTMPWLENRANAGAHAAAAAAAPARVTTILPQTAPVPIRSPLPNNSPVGSNFSTAGQSPSPLPSASPTPTPAPTPAQLL